MVLILRGIALRPQVTGDNLLSEQDCRELRRAADLIERLAIRVRKVERVPFVIEESDA